MQPDEQALRKIIGKNIALYRKAHRDTQAVVGQKLNYSDKAVSKWERGESTPDIYVLSRIAELYDVSVGVLIGESQPEIQDSPYLHLFVFLFSVALTFLIATVLIVAFEIFNVPFNTWLFLLYAAALSALEAVIFTSLWWDLWRQLAAWSSLIWLGGLAVLLTVRGIVAAKSLMICAALEAMVLFWILYRRSKIPKEEGKQDE
ncbi:MAG: helix-turn-helix transcriptional regulator [Clostridia bacterium]|nr:helix-turn-helix transcriptional regulator [Clostridia bacterium]